MTGPIVLVPELGMPLEEGDKCSKNIHTHTKKPYKKVIRAKRVIRNSETIPVFDCFNTLTTRKFV